MRLSILDVYLEADAGGEIGLDRAGDHVGGRALGRHDEVNAGRPRHLSDPLDGGFHFLAGGQHQVRDLVDHDDDVGEGVSRSIRLLAQIRHTGVVAGDVANPELGHGLVAIFHLSHGPLERGNGLVRIGHHGRKQMRNAVIGRQLQHLRVDHDETALIGSEPEKQRLDHRADPHRLA